MTDDLLLEVTLKNQSPIELNDLGRALNSLADEFNRFSNRHQVNSNAKLFVKEVRKGSIVIDLISSVPVLLPIAEQFNTVFEFGSFIKNAFDYLLDRTNDRPEGDSKTFENIANIVNPIAGNKGSQINISVSNTGNGDIYVQIPATEEESQRIKTKAGFEKEKLQLPNVDLKERVTMYIYQARNEIKSKSGDKGIIESISKQPKKIIFGNEGIKREIMNSDENVFHYAYVVDVVVETKEEKPIAYKIMNYHEKFQLDE